jgi:predicted Zn-dependent protease
MKKSSFIFFLLININFISLFAGEVSTYQKGWEGISSNNRADARKYFTQAVSNSSTNSDALLSLCLLNWYEQKDESALESFRQFYESSPNPYPYIYAVNSLSFMRETSKKKLAFVEKIVADPKMNGTIKTLLYEELGEYYTANNNQKKSKEWFSKMGAIDNWQILGTFDNTSGSGFSKDWGAVEKASTKEVFKNKVDADVKWYTPPFNKANHWFYFDYHFSLNSTIIYAQTFVTSPADQTVYLRIGTSGSLKAWVNDALVLSVPEERNCDLDIYAAQVKLKKGNNRLLIQIGQSEIDNANFMVRLTDVDAHPIEGLTFSSEYASYKKSNEQPTTSEPLPFFVEEFFLNKIKESPQNPLNYFLLAETYLRNDKAYEATKLLKQLEELLPNSSLVSYRLAEAYIRSRNQTDYDKETEKIKKIDPNSFFALESEYDEAIQSEKYADAEAICKKVKELYGVNSSTENWDLSLASLQKKNLELIEMVKAMYKKYPDNYTYMYYSYLIEKNSAKNPKTAVAIVEKFAKKYFVPKGMELLANIYFEQGNLDKGLSVLKQRLAVMPYAIGYLDDLQSIYFRMQRYPDALAVTDQMLALSPYLSGIYNSRGYIYNSMKETIKAKESFKKAIYYGPTSYDSRKQLRQLENKKEINELFPKVDLVSIVAKAPGAKDYPQDNSIILLNDNHIIVYPEGAKEYRYEMAVKILNQSGISVWKEYTIGYNSNTQKLIIDKAEVIKANGSKVKAETDDDNSIVFTNLEVNDVLHLDYRIQDYSTGKLAKHFFNHFLFKYSIPSLSNRYCILVPKDKPFQHLIANGSITPKVTDIEDMKLYEWELTNQPAVVNEPYMSVLSDVVPTLFYSSMPDWRYVSNWYKDLTSSKFKSDYVLKETVASILKGKENVTQLEKARLFYNYILENITYSNVAFLQSNYIPQKASRTITTRLGDCKDVATLFVTFCREVGIEANLVLISTRNYGNKTMPLPAIDFNHCIAQLNLDEKVYYLELTDNTLPFGAASSVSIDSEMLPIPYADETFGDRIITLQMPFRPKNTVSRVNDITISGNDMQINRRNTYWAAVASSLRDTYRNIGTEEQMKTMNEAVASDFSVQTKVSDLKFTDLDNLNDNMSIEYKIEVKNVLQDVAGMKILKLPWVNKISSLELVTAETRNYPIEFWQYLSHDYNTEQINLTLPQGKKLVEIPKDVHLECANAVYDLKFKVLANGQICINRNFVRKTDQILPKEYNAFREFLNKVSESDNKQYAIK